METIGGRCLNIVINTQCVYTDKEISRKAYLPDPDRFFCLNSIKKAPLDALHFTTKIIKSYALILFRELDS